MILIPNKEKDYLAFRDITERPLQEVTTANNNTINKHKIHTLILHRYRRRLYHQYQYQCEAMSCAEFYQNQSQY